MEPETVPQACSQRRQTSAQTRQCTCSVAWRSHSAQARQVSEQGASAARLSAADGLPNGRFDAGVSAAPTLLRRAVLLRGSARPRGPNMPRKAVHALALAAVLSTAASAGTAPKTYRLTATPDTVQWGWLDPKEPPKLTIESGEIVSIETLMHARDQIQKGTTIEKIVELRKANPGGGPHSLTGPIFVKGAKPGDVMEIRIRKIVPKKVGMNFNLPGKEFPTIGALATQFPEGYVHYFDLDPKKPTATCLLYTSDAADERS